MPFEVVPNHSVDEAGITNPNYLDTQEQKTVDNANVTDFNQKKEELKPRVSKSK